jgi:hypothetical protein
LRGQRRAQKMQQCGFAAEQMRATGDVEKQPMRRIERHQRREAVAPVGDVIQQFGVGGLIGVEHLQMRANRPRIGQRQTDLEAEIGGGIIQRVDLQHVVLLGDDDAGVVLGDILELWRTFVFNPPAAVADELPLDAVDGQAWQPQAEDTPRVR